MAKKTTRLRLVRPDTPDFRDLPFRPNIGIPPKPYVFPRYSLTVKNQHDTSACTGFSLSLVVEYLLRKAKRENSPKISPYMLYSMARRYDEFPGTSDEGSSLRGALKGWHKHGACADKLWKTGIHIPPAPKQAANDWWLDAVNRPLGAYYRIDPKLIVDIHAALNEVGIVYASVDTHAGWDQGNDLKLKRPKSFNSKIFAIPAMPGGAGGHAIALVGYNEQGFLLQNSWDSAWGSGGYALLSYEDWTQNAMDCWVAQLGVVTEEHKALAASNTLRTNQRGQVTLASRTTLRDREISPFIINMANNGEPSSSGLFRTSVSDIDALVDIHLAEARARWKLGSKPIDICIYAHGGLTSEKDAAATAADWIPMLYNEQIFPIFLMWETDLLSTICNRLSDAIRDVSRPAGAGEAFWSRTERWWNERLERLLVKPGTLVWEEMKQNAIAISQAENSGAALLYNAFNNSVSSNHAIRIHLVGHSAGSIVHAYIIKALVKKWKFESVNLLAPAIRLDTFDELVLPHIKSGRISRYQQFHLSEKAEEDDCTCTPYKRSLLHLVAKSFEGGKHTEILGLKQDLKPSLTKLKNVSLHTAPCSSSTSTTHGGFDNDKATREQVIRHIKQS